MTVKLYIYRYLARFFAWLERVAGGLNWKFDYCETCGKNKYFEQPGEPCVSLIEERRRQSRIQV